MEVHTPRSAGRAVGRETLVSVVAVACFGLTILAGAVGYELGPLRALVGVVVLGFLPGHLLLGALGASVRRPSRWVVYSVGLSASFVMIFGTVVNFLGRVVGVSRPLSAEPLGTAVVVALAGLLAVVEVRSSDASTRTPAFDWGAWTDGNSRSAASVFLHPAPLFLALVPCLAVLGALVMNAFGENRLVLLFLLSAALVPVLIATGLLPDRWIPAGIFSTGLGVALHMSLITPHLWSWDVHYSYYSAQLARSTGYWDPSVPETANSLLLMTILAPAYSTLAGLELAMVFKLVFPLLLAFVPLGIYELARSQFETPMVARLAPFPFVFYYGYFKDMPGKQHLAELFVVLLLVVALDRNLADATRRGLAVVFGFAIVVSHYGVGFIVVPFVVVVAVVMAFRNEPSRLDFNLAALLSVLVVCWYMLTASGAKFETLTVILFGMVSRLTEMFASPPTRSGADYASTAHESLVWSLYYYATYVFVGLTALGVSRLGISLLRRNQPCRDTEFTLFSICMAAFLGASLFVPFGMGFDRTLQLSLVVLSPFMLVGGRTIAGGVGALLRRVSIPTVSGLSTGTIGAFLGAYLLLSSGFAFSVAGERAPPYAMAVDQNVDWMRYDVSEVAGIEWLAEHDEYGHVAVFNRPFIIKSQDGLLVAEQFPLADIEPVRASTDGTESRFVFVASESLTGVGPSDETPFRESRFYRSVLADANLIYDAGDARVYRP